MLLLSFCAGCSQNDYENIYLQGDNNPTTPIAGDIVLPPSDYNPDYNEYISDLLTNPQTPHVLKEIPGYFNYRGILVSGSNIELAGYSRVIGGVYALGNLKMGAGSSIVEDSSLIANAYKTFTESPITSANLTVFPTYIDGSNIAPRVPFIMQKIPKRAHVLQTQEITLKPGEDFPKIDTVINELKAGNQ